MKLTHRDDKKYTYNPWTQCHRCRKRIWKGEKYIPTPDGNIHEKCGTEAERHKFDDPMFDKLCGWPIMPDGKHKKGR